MRISSFEKLKTTSKLSLKESRGPKVILIAVLAMAVGALVLWLADRIFLLSISRSYVDQVAVAFDLNRHLAEAISLVVCVFLVAFVTLAFSFSRRKRLVGILGVVALFVLNSLALWHGTKTQFFEASGAASKCYVLTRQGVRFGEHAGVDAETGQPCRSVTPDMMERLAAYSKGNRPSRIANEDPQFFDLKTGEPNVWFAKDQSGDIELFDLMGFHPQTGEELQPINKGVVQEWRLQQRQITDRVPSRIEDPKSFTYFDPKTGKPRAWYWVGSDKNYEFYDNKGFHPRTGEPLKVVSRDVLTDWNALNASKCYVVTRESVRFGIKPGLDAQTGRECRVFTPALLERLKDYEKGLRPKKIVASDVAFFDLRTGEPNVWYSRDDKGRIKLFDLIGFDPENGQELLPVSTETVALWRRQNDPASQKAPKLIDPEQYPFFNVVSGDAQVWYWRGGLGEWEFYDNAGFRKTGEKLTLISPEIVEAYRQDFGEVRRQAAARAAEVERQQKSAQEELRRERDEEAARLAKQKLLASQRPPNLIDPERYPFFNTVTGEPQVWYWRGAVGEWEFYDNSGFRRTGEKLTPISQDIIDTARREVFEAKRQAADKAAEAERQQRAAQDAARRAQEAETSRQLALQRAENAKADADKQSAMQCDRLAANPTDYHRPNDIAGVEYNDLKGDSRAAAEICAQAVKAFPDELRYRYNWARALEFVNPQQAINIYVYLTKQQYAAAYDNLGGVIWRERKDLPGAIKQYEIGVKLNDPGAMVSLAFLIKHNNYPVQNSEATRHSLLVKAAQAGHKGAQDTLNQEQQESQARAYRQQNELAQQQMMLNVFGGVVRGLAR